MNCEELAQLIPDMVDGTLSADVLAKAQAILFAWGARDAARNVIAGFYVRQNFPPGQRLTLGEYSGRVRSTAGAYTVLETTDEQGNENGTVSLPNTILLASAVRGQEEITTASSDTPHPSP